MGGALDSYTPTWTGITTGNGTSTGGYKQLGRITLWRARFVLGTTSAITGGVTVSLPVALRDTNETGTHTMRILDSGTAWYIGIVAPSTTTAVVLYVANTSTAYMSETSLSSTVPMTWATGDQIVVSGVYEAAT